MKKILSFKINNEIYAVNVMNVVSIDQRTHITELPLAPKHVLGVINMRGQIVPVLSLRKLFNFGDDRNDKSSCVVFLETEAGQLGCQIDEVCDVTEINAKDENTSLVDTLQSDNSKFLEQIIKLNDRIVFILNCNRIYDSVSMEIPKDLNLNSAVKQAA